MRMGPHMMMPRDGDVVKGAKVRRSDMCRAWTFARPYRRSIIGFLVSILGSGLYNVILALAIPASITGSRLQRAASMQVTGRDYVLAARSLGATDARIITRYILPNIMAPIIIVVSLGFGGYILAESSLSFLGYGVPPPAPSWGGMLASDGRRYMYVAPHMFVAPAIALSVVVFGVNMFGDAMRDILDPRLRGSS